MTRASRRFDFSDRDELLRDPGNAVVYLADFLETGDMELFQEALKDVALAQQGGLAALAEQAQLNRGSLHKALSRSGKPQIATINKMLGALGLRLTVTQARQPSKATKKPTTSASPA
ncbi:addiction module antidote protein [Rhizobium sp.]